MGDEIGGTNCFQTLRRLIKAVGRARRGSAHSKIHASPFNGGLKPKISSMVWKYLNPPSTKARPSIIRIGLKVWSRSIILRKIALFGLQR
jgi:hypothetical protein